LFAATSKRVFFWIGLILALTGIIFVLHRFVKFSDQINFSQFTSQFWLGILLLSFIYGIFSINLALAWAELLKHFKSNISKQWAISVYGQTQLAKYVPGNIFHFASRQLLGQSKGIKAVLLAKVLVFEHLLLSVIAVLAAVLLLPNFIHFINQTQAFAAYCFIFLLLIFMVNYIWSIHIARAFIYQGIFIIISGLIFANILALLTEQNFWALPNLNIVISGYVLAWLFGMLMPGAPAGIGVRELLISLFLGSYFSPADLTLAVVLSRFVTLTGDFIFFILSSYLSIKQHSNTSN